MFHRVHGLSAHSVMRSSIKMIIAIMDIFVLNVKKHFRMSAPQRLKMILDKGTYTPLFLELTTENVLDFKGYEHKIQGLQEKDRHR